MKTSVKVCNSRFRPIALATACLLATFMAGCDPEDIVRWAPDGQTAIVRGGDNTYVVDAAGSVIATARGARSWMPDSRHVLVVRTVKPRDWAEYAALLGPERAHAVVAAAEELRALIRDYKGAWADFAESQPVKRWEASHATLAAGYGGGDDWVETDVDAGRMTLLYLRQTYPEEIAPLEKALAEHDGATEYEALISELVVRSVIPGENDEQLLVRSVDDIIWCRAAPHGGAVAYVISEPAHPALYVVAAHGGEPVRVDEGAIEAAWTREGRWLVYIKTTLPYDALQDQMLLGTITRRHVCDEAQLVGKLDDAEDLAGLLLGKGIGRIECLPDGRILFAGTMVKLPAATSDLPKEVTLFALQLGDTPTIERLVSERAQALLPNRVDRFAVSPDGASVLIPGDSGEVAVLSLKSGDVQTLQETIPAFRDTGTLANGEGLMRPAPTWRSATEVCYVVPAGNPHGSRARAEVIVRTLGGDSRALSKSWPNALADRFLPRLKQ